jgi:hypothetical protein
MPGLNCTVWVDVTPDVPVTKSSTPFLVKPASSVKCTGLLKKGSSPHCRGASGKILRVSENQADLELLPVANGTGTATVHGECATCSAAVHAVLSLLRTTVEGPTMPVSLMRR